MAEREATDQVRGSTVRVVGGEVPGRARDSMVIYRGLTVLVKPWRVSHFVYILASRPNGPIYIGAARDLRRRVEQHRAGAVPGHTARYNITRLVWFERHGNMRDGLLREKRLKRWRRDWKDLLIAEHNPDWRDVSAEIPF